MNRRILGVTVMTAVCLAGVQTTRADLPANRTVYLYMYETPGDPESDVVFSIALDVAASDIDGNWVGWMITSIEFREFGTPDTVWIDDSPVVDSPDGLWWVEHADPLSPQPGEFTVLPLLEGTAIAQDAYGTDLGYVLHGAVYELPPSGAPYSATAAIDYTLTLQGQQNPERDGACEPVEASEQPHELE